jgi:hypothetical protein
LRDSGTSSPPGGLAFSGTAVRGLPRMINGLVDRGSGEAQPPDKTGPIITALEPNSGGTTVLPATGDPTRTTRTPRVFFFTQSGNGTGQSTLAYAVTAANGVVIVRPVQTIPDSGGNVLATRACPVYREKALSRVKCNTFF